VATFANAVRNCAGTPGKLPPNVWPSGRVPIRRHRGNTEAMRPANEIRFEARWKLGQLLAKVAREERERSAEGTYVPARDTGFRAYLKEIGLNKNRANECERTDLKRPIGLKVR
jgi:hypothetical protein